VFVAGSNNAAVRRAIRSILRTDAPLLAVVPRDRIHGQRVPASESYPYVRLGSPSSTPIRGACVDGSDTVVAVHAFATPRKDGVGNVVEDAEDFADRIGAMIASALDKHVVTDANGRLRLIWTGEQLLQDPSEADCFHTVQNFRVRAITA
jgi:hypothetical protein